MASIIKQSSVKNTLQISAYLVPIIILLGTGVFFVLDAKYAKSAEIKALKERIIKLETGTARDIAHIRQALDRIDKKLENF